MKVPPTYCLPKTFTQNDMSLPKNILPILYSLPETLHLKLLPSDIILQNLAPQFATQYLCP